MLLALARSHCHDWAMSVVNYKIGDAPLDRSSYASMAPSAHDDEIRFQVLRQSHNLLSHTPKPEMGSAHSPPLIFTRQVSFRSISWDSCSISS
jgi:hypothetical protein